MLCHGAGKTYDVAAVHAITGNIQTGITGVAFADNGANKVVTVSFDFSDSSVDLAELNPSNSTQLRYARFYLAKLVPGTSLPGAGTEPDVWVRTVSGERLPANLTKVDADSYTYTFNYNVLAADQAYTHRIGINFSGLPDGKIAQFATNDAVPDGSAVTVTRNIVTTAACQQCHDPLGGGAAVFHGGSRNKAEACVLCHRTVQGARDNTVLTFNPDTGLFEGTGQAYYPYMVHKIHGTRQMIENGHGTSWIWHDRDWAEVAYPQDVRNCTTCHKGADGENWKNRPSQAACGSCHATVNFATGANHVGGAYANNLLCAACHTPALIEGYHATENATPNNPQLHTGLSTFEYGINSVTVNADNRAVVKFWIKRDGSFVDLLNPEDNTVRRPSGLTGGPSFLVAYANNVTSPQDYSNFGRTAGQPASASIVGLPVTITGSEPSEYTVTLPTSAAFPADAKMRAVALQGYFSQTVDGTSVGRHTPSVQKAVTGDAVRRQIIKSGYNAATGAPEGCLECHEIFEGHGGNRVNNVQVCVMCHNPSNTSSGRTIDPASATPINPEIVSRFGSDPLAYPEVPNNFKDLIHGIHSGSMRVSPFEDIRNRTTGGFQGVFVTSDHVTFPGNLKNCNKCHAGDSYKANLPLGVDFSTAKITTGSSSETRSDVMTARSTVPNSTDLVTTPTVAACGMCHNSGTSISHFQVMGGKVQAEREYAELPVPTMSVP